MPAVRENCVKYSVKTGVLLGLALAAGPVLAADVRYVPQLKMQVETNDNFNLAPEGAVAADTEGYIADAELLIDIASPRGSTSLRPRL